MVEPVITNFEIPDRDGRYKKCLKQSGAELGQAQLKLELGFTSNMICCIKLIR